MPRKPKKLTMSDSVLALHNHLKESGTGEQKLVLVSKCADIKEALKKLEEKHPGTFAKAVKWVETSDEYAKVEQAEAERLAKEAADHAAAVAARRAEKQKQRESAGPSKTDDKPAATK